MATYHMFGVIETILGRAGLVSDYYDRVRVFDLQILFECRNRLIGLVVTASASTAKDPGFESRLSRDFSGSSHTSDLKIGTPVATLPGAWHYSASARTCRPCVSIL